MTWRLRGHALGRLRELPPPLYIAITPAAPSGCGYRGLPAKLCGCPGRTRAHTQPRRARIRGADPGHENPVQPWSRTPRRIQAPWRSAGAPAGIYCEFGTLLMALGLAPERRTTRSRAL